MSCAVVDPMVEAGLDNAVRTCLGDDGEWSVSVDEDGRYKLTVTSSVGTLHAWRQYSGLVAAAWRLAEGLAGEDGMGKGQRRKGGSFERDVAKRFLKLGFSRSRRQPQSQGARAGCDVEGTPFWIEAKHHKKVSIPGAIKQALKDKEERNDDRPMLVVAKNDYGPVYVTMDWETFEKLYNGEYRSDT